MSSLSDHTFYEESKPNFQGQDVLEAQIYIFLAFFILYLLTRSLAWIKCPMNYELDMTTTLYCKPLAEIDNSIRYMRGPLGEFHPNVVRRVPQKNLPDVEDIGKYGPLTRDMVLEDLESSANLVYPNGWLPIMESARVNMGTVRRAMFLGRDLLVARATNGEVSVLDAYCPHSGVNMGVGGKIRTLNDESCLECPFHGWQFRLSNGECVRIPYQKPSASIPKQSRLFKWTCDEIDNMIYVWYHSDPNQGPTWFLTPTKELQTNEWMLAGRTCHTTNFELRDLLENGADINHFDGIHGDFVFLGENITRMAKFEFLKNYLSHKYSSNWEPMACEVSGRQTHIAKTQLVSSLKLFSFDILEITVSAVQLGPARVDLRYNSKFYGHGKLIMNAINLGGRRSKYIQHLYTKPTILNIMGGRMFFYGEIKMLERDFIIWNHKKTIKNPCLVPGDKTLRKFRLWYKQFYKTNIPIKIQQSSATNDDEYSDCQQEYDCNANIII